MTFRTLGYRNIDSRPNLWYKGIRSEEISHGLPVYLYPNPHNLLLLWQSRKPRRVPAPAAHAPLPRPFPEYGKGSTDFPLLFGDLMQWYRKGTAVAEIALPQTASLLLFHLTSAFLDRRESRPLTLTPVIVAVKEYIRTNCHTALTTSEIAAKYGYNCAYLSSLFKKETGISMTECIHRERISLAQMLLSNPAISIKEAAFSSGFTDEKYFMKLFRRYTGMTPSAYRALTPYG